MMIPESPVDAVRKIQDTVLICPPHVSQAAAVGALAAGRAYCDRHVTALASVRRRVLEQLAAIGDLAEAPSADGALYCLVRVKTALDSMTLAERLIREHHIATAPGSAFGLPVRRSPGGGGRRVLPARVVLVRWRRRRSMKGCRGSCVASNGL